MIKRALDLLIAVPAALLSAPVVALLALAIRLESPGYPIYKQTRVGRDGQTFSIYKLRTMVRGAEFIGAGLAIQESDERITRMGEFLRRYSLDELPNLWNVLRGEMSIVGPRPTIPVQVSQYTERQMGRLKVKPGITGWAQVNGRAALPWTERIELDLWYVEHQSLALDLRILARTAGLVGSGTGLYKGETGGWLKPSQTSSAPPPSAPARPAAAANADGTVSHPASAPTQPGRAPTQPASPSSSPPAPSAETTPHT